MCPVKSLPRRRRFVEGETGWVLSGYCPKNAEMYLFGLHSAASLGFRRYIRHVGVFHPMCQEKRVVVFLRPSRVAHVAHIHAARL